MVGFVGTDGHFEDLAQLKLIKRNIQFNQEKTLKIHERYTKNLSLGSPQQTASIL